MNNLANAELTQLHQDIVLISTADWDNPFWTNKQHMALQFAKRGSRVLYIESIGLRRPSMSKQDLSRIWRRLLRGLKPPKLVVENVWVWSPLVIPLQKFALVRRFNKILFAFLLKIWTLKLGHKRNILWTYSPLTTSFVDIRKYRLVVYHAVDDIKEQPGMPREVIEVADNQLSRESDYVFTTSKSLYDNHINFNDKTFYFSNVADFDHFNKAMRQDTVVPDDLGKIPAPRIGLIGALSGYKVDFDLLRQIAIDEPSYSIVLIGAVGEGDPWTKVKGLADLPNVYFMGGRPYDLLPAYLKGIDVAILANNDNDYTKSMFPMKFFEYLAAGRPVVSTKLPALADYDNIAAFCTGAEEFRNALHVALTGGAPDIQLRLSAAKDNTYDKRTERMLAVLAPAL